MKAILPFIIALNCLGAVPALADPVIPDQDAKRIIIEDNRFDEQDYHWSKTPGDWMPALIEVIEDFTRDANKLECFTVIAEGNKTEHVGGVEHEDVMYVDFVFKADYSASRWGPPKKSRGGCGLNMHYSVNKGGKILLKYKQK